MQGIGHVTVHRQKPNQGKEEVTEEVMEDSQEDVDQSETRKIIKMMTQQLQS